MVAGVRVLIRFAQAAPAGAHYRALRGDVEFPFVELAEVDAGGPDVYEVVRETGSVTDPGGVLLITPLEDPAGWDDLAGARGQLGTRLHRAVGSAPFAFVAVTRWSSPLMYSRAVERPAPRAVLYLAA